MQHNGWDHALKVTAYHSESTYLENTPTVQLTRIVAADRLFPRFNTHSKCTGVCRFVRGIPAGIGRRAAKLWGFCGARRSPDWPGLPGTAIRIPPT